MAELIPNDPIFAQSWHLRDTAGIDTDINVTWVWEDYTGEGVRVGVYDDGVGYIHSDLNDNYNRTRHFHYQFSEQDAGASVSQNHGTAVSGIIAAEANNGIGSVGVAYDAEVSGVPIYGIWTTELIAYRTAAYAHQSAFDVVNHSYGSTAFSDWSLVGNEQYEAAVNGALQAAINGRAGLGTSIVGSAGNGRADAMGSGGPNDASISGGVQSARNTIVVGGLGQDGFVSDYSNPGSNLLVVAPTTANLPVATDDLDNRCAWRQRLQHECQTER